MSMISLSFTLAFVVISMMLSIWLKIGLQRDMVVATIRSTVQLLVVGYVLRFVFDVRSTVLILLMITFMIAVATQNANKRGKGLQGVWWRILVSISVTEAITQGMLLGLKVVQPTPQYIISISGIIIGNAMVTSGLFLNRLASETAAHEPEIVSILSLGGTPKQSVLPFVKQAIRASMLPTIDNTKTMGVVQLPGMMTGLIIGGADPIQAVRYQLLIVFSLMASVALSSIILGFLTYPCLFNEHEQFVLRTTK